jgi:putative DNA primase/helicase
MLSPENYINDATNNEVATAAIAISFTGNQDLTRAAFQLGTIPGMTTDTAISALLLAPRSKGYVKEHGKKATPQVIQSGEQQPPRAIDGPGPLSPLGRPDAAPVNVTESPRSAAMLTADPKSDQPMASAFPQLLEATAAAGATATFTGGGAAVTLDGALAVSDVDSGGNLTGATVTISTGLLSGDTMNFTNQNGITGSYDAATGAPTLTGTASLGNYQSALDSITYSFNPTNGDPIGGAANDTSRTISFVVNDGVTSSTAVTSTVDTVHLPPTAAADADARAPERNDERLYEPRAAQILRDCRRDVALAPADAKEIAFQEVAKRIGQAVADQWLPKAVMVDWLMDIAQAHGSFGLSPDELQNLICDAAVAAATVEVRIPKTPPASARPKRHLISHRASDIQPERIEWIWAGRLARGKVALLGGPPGLGKSQVTANMAATVSMGGRWPCNEGTALQGDVLILSAEDGIADTIIPRLIAAGADMDRVRIVAAATKSDGTGRKTFSLKTDVDLLEELAREMGTVLLIIIDPISAYMGGADGNGNVETREVLEPLAEMANRLGIAVVAVTHLNKGGAGGQSALNRFAGSIAFVAAARSAYLVIEDTDDENRRLFLQAKNNLGPKGKGLAFRVEQRLIPGDILASNISWDTDHVTASVDEALLASETRGGGESRSGKDEAADFLRVLLASGAMPVTEVEREARDAGLLGPDSPISQNKSFRSARDILGIAPQRKGGTGANGQWVWELPATPKMPSKPYDAPFVKEGTLGDRGHLSGSEATS